MPSKQIKDEETYRELRKDGASKEKAARIANAAHNEGREAVGRKGGKAGDYDDWTKDWTIRAGIEPDDREALIPLLARGASIRFLATRAYDWLHTPADAMVTRKDPMDFARRLSFYAANGAQAFTRPQNGGPAR